MHVNLNLIDVKKEPQLFSFKCSFKDHSQNHGFICAIYNLSLETLEEERKEDLLMISETIHSRLVFTYTLGRNHMSEGEGVSYPKCELALRKPLGF